MHAPKLWLLIVRTIAFAVVFTLSGICNGVTSSTPCSLIIVVHRRLGKQSWTTLLVCWWFVSFVRLCQAPKKWSPNFNLSSVTCYRLNLSLSIVFPTRMCKTTPTQNNPQSIPLICCGHSWYWSLTNTSWCARCKWSCSGLWNTKLYKSSFTSATISDESEGSCVPALVELHNKL